MRDRSKWRLTLTGLAVIVAVALLLAVVFGFDLFTETRLKKGMTITVKARVAVLEWHDGDRCRLGTGSTIHIYGLTHYAAFVCVQQAWGLPADNPEGLPPCPACTTAAVNRESLSRLLAAQPEAPVSDAGLPRFPCRPPAPASGD
jgi:hypothetical protein